MTSSFNVNQSQINPYSAYQAYQEPSEPSVIRPALFGAGAGFVTGAGVKAGVDFIKTRRAVKNGNATDSFCQKVLDRLVEKDYVSKGKKFFKEQKALLKELSSVKSPEQFSKIMKKYKTYAATLCDGISLQTMCNTVNKDNIKDKVSALKKRIQSSLEPEIQNVKDTIKACWDSDKKKFVKPSGVSDKVFKVIKNTKNSIEWGKVAKWGGISAGIAGVIGLGLGIFAKRAFNQQLALQNPEYNQQ